MASALHDFKGTIAIVGCGGLGVPMAWTLAGHGARSLLLVDDDAVELGNLHRQILFGDIDIGKLKAEVLASQLRQRFADCAVTIVPHRVTADSAGAVLAGCVAVCEGSDDAVAKFAVNDWLVADRSRTGVVAAAIGARGQWMAIGAQTACYRCLFEAPPPAQLLATCSVAGVIGTTVGMVGSLAARSLVAMLNGQPDPATGALVRWGSRGLLRTPVLAAADCICARPPYPVPPDRGLAVA